MCFRGLLLLLALPQSVFSAGTPGTRCTHDAVIASLAPVLEREPLSAQAYVSRDGATAGGGVRGLQSSSMSPLRIVPIYADGLAPVASASAAVLPAGQVALAKSLVADATAKWASLLSVYPVQGALFAQPACANYFADGSGCATFQVDTQCATTQGTGDATLSFTRAYASYLAGGSGLAGADVGLFVTAVSSSQCGVDGFGTVAYAVGCGRDQYDRPIWGRLNVCPGFLSLNPTPAEREALLSAVLHELGHLLGFTAESFALFRNPADLAPMTPRNPVYGGVADAYKVKLTGQCSSFSVGVAASTTINYAPERGTSCAWDAATAAGSNIPYGATSKTPIDCVARIVTPAATAAARAFFDCPTLAGVELENQDTLTCWAQGSHLEQRVHNTDLMAPFAQQVALISPVMLGVFQDSGWYSANFAAASAWREGLDYGYHAGCAFAGGSTCSASNVGQYSASNLPWHFDLPLATVPCSGNAPCFTHNEGLGNAVCTTDRRAWGSVRLGALSPQPPTSMRYFPSNPALGSPAPATDFCPTVEPGTSCTDADSLVLTSYESFGNASMCLEATPSSTNSINVGKATFGVGCFKIVCSPAAGGLPASVSLDIPGTGRLPCPRGPGSTVTLPNAVSQGNDLVGLVVSCPEPAVVCTPGSVWAPSAPFANPVAAAAATGAVAGPNIVPIAVGGAVGGFVALVLVAAAVWYFFFRRKPESEGGHGRAMSRQSSFTSAPGTPRDFLETPRAVEDTDAPAEAGAAAGVLAAGVGLKAKPVSGAGSRGPGAMDKDPVVASTAPGSPVLPLIAAAKASAAAQRVADMGPRGAPGSVKGKGAAPVPASSTGLRLPPLASPFSPVYIPVSSDTPRAEGDEGGGASPTGEGGGASPSGGGGVSPRAPAFSPSVLPGVASDVRTSPVLVASPKPRPTAASSSRYGAAPSSAVKGGTK